MSLQIDGQLAATWEKAGVRPAAGIDDATFLRRSSLDLIGRIPTVSEVRDFLNSSDPQKRARLVAS